MSIKFGVLVSALCSTFLFSSCENEERAEVNDEVTQMVSTINSKCPVMVDSETQLVNVQVLPDPGIRYNFKLVKVLQAIDTVGLKNMLWPGLLANIKVDGALQVLRDQNYSFVYSYQDKDGKYMCSVLIRPKDYQLQKP